ncbi:hypothetical protein SCUP234_12265 [Seiridium cupressi]
MASALVNKEEAVVLAGRPPTWGFGKYTDAEPPMQFFTDAPTTTPAYFSTQYGRKARRFNAGFPPHRRIFAWSAAQIQTAVDHIGEHCWQVRKSIPKPDHYGILHIYWDPFDLWHMGVQNAWNVLNSMYWETQQILPTLLARVRQVIEEWCWGLLSDQARRQRFFYWQPQQNSDFLRVFEGTELVGIQGIDIWYLPLVRDVLAQTHHDLHTGAWQERIASQPEPPQDSQENISAKVEAIEKAAFGITSIPAVQTGNKTVSGVCVVDGTSATAAQVLRQKANSGGADPSSSLPSPCAGRMIQAAIKTDIRESLEEESLVDDAQAASHTDSEIGATTIVKDNTQKAEPSQRAARLSDRERNPSSSTDKSTKIAFDDHPLRPRPTGTIYHDRPPTIENEIGDQDQVFLNNAPRTAATGSLDGPLLGRYGAAPDLIYTAHRALSNYQQRPTFQNDARQNSIVPITEEIAALNFYEENSHGRQGAQEFRYPILPKHGQLGSVQRTISQASIMACSPSPIHPQQIGPPGPLYRQPQIPQMPSDVLQNHRISGLRPANNNWVQQGVDIVHGPIMRHSPPKKRPDSKRQQHSSELLSNTGYQNWPGYSGNDQAFFPGPPMASVDRHWGNSRGSHSPASTGHTPLNGPSIGNQQHVSARREYAADRNARSVTAVVRTQCLNWRPGKTPAQAPFMEYKPCPCDHCQDKDHTVFVGICNHGDLDSPEKRERLYAIFSQFGQIKAIRVKSDGRFVQIQFYDMPSVWRARALDRTVIEGICDHTLRVSHPIGSQYFEPHKRPEGKRVQHYGFDLQSSDQPGYILPHLRSYAPVCPEGQPRHGAQQSTTPTASRPSGATSLIPLDSRGFSERLHPSIESTNAQGRARAPHPILDAESNYAVTEREMSPEDEDPTLAPVSGTLNHPSSGHLVSEQADRTDVKTLPIDPPGTSSASAAKGASHSQKSSMILKQDSSPGQAQTQHSVTGIESAIDDQRCDQVTSIPSGHSSLPRSHSTIMDVGDGSATVIRRPEQARRNKLPVEWIHTESARGTSLSYSHADDGHRQAMLSNQHPVSAGYEGNDNNERSGSVKHSAKGVGQISSSGLPADNLVATHKTFYQDPNLQPPVP